MPSEFFQPTCLQMVTVPIVAGLLIYIFGGLSRWLQRLLALAASAWMLMVAVTMLTNLDAAADGANQVFRPLVSYGIFQLNLDLQIDALRALLLVGVAGFTFLVSLYSVKAASGLPKERRYWTFVLWAGAGAAMVLMADNLWLLLMSWEVVTVMLYLLANYGQAEARKGAFKTFAVLGFADAALLLGIVILILKAPGAVTNPVPALHEIRQIGTDTGWMTFCYVLFMVAALAKAGAMPLHTWLPAMAVKSPAAVFALLPAAIDKLLGIFLLAIIGLQLFALSSALMMVLMVIGAATILCAVLMAMIQHNLKRLLSFHAVSQVGYMVLGLGTGNPIGIVGGLFHMINNTVYKSALMLMAGNVEDETGTVNLDRIGGLARRLPWTFGATVVAALAISGIPPLNGFVSKWLVYQGLLQGAADSKVMIVFLIVAVFGSALTLASFVKVLHGVFLGERPTGMLLTGRGRSPWRAVPIVVLATLCIVLGVWATGFMTNWMLPAVKDTLGVDISQFSGEAATTGSLETGVGVWSPTWATGLIGIGVVLGLIFYLMTSVMKVRVTPTFIGGETAAGPSARFGGINFYETIRRLPVLRTIFTDAEAGAFDGYRLVGGGGKALVKRLRSWHSGLLPVYVAWVLFGLLAMVLWLLFG